MKMQVILKAPLHSRALIMLALLTSFAAAQASAQRAKPNLTGTWKLNVTKSKPLPRTGPETTVTRSSI